MIRSIALTVLKTVRLWGLRSITRADPWLYQPSAGLQGLLACTVPLSGNMLDGQPAGEAAQ